MSQPESRTLEQLVQQWRDLASDLRNSTNTVEFGKAQGLRMAANDVEAWLLANPAAQDTRTAAELTSGILDDCDHFESDYPFDEKLMHFIERVRAAISAQSLPASTPAEGA